MSTPGAYGPTDGGPFDECEECGQGIAPGEGGWLNGEMLCDECLLDELVEDDDDDDDDGDDGDDGGEYDENDTVGAEEFNWDDGQGD